MAELLVMTKNSNGSGPRYFRAGDMVIEKPNGHKWGGEEIVLPMTKFVVYRRFAPARRVTPSIPNGLVYRLLHDSGFSTSEPVWGTEVGGITAAPVWVDGELSDDPKYINTWECLGPDTSVYRTMAVLKIPDLPDGKATKYLQPEYVLQDRASGTIQRRLWGFLIANVPKVVKDAIASDGFYSSNVASIKKYIRNKNTNEEATFNG